MQSTVSKTVNAPIDRVWAIIADHEGMAKWAPGLSAAILKDGADTRNGVGAVRELKGPLSVPTIVEEIVGFEPQRRLAYRALSGVPLKNYTGEIVLTPQGTERTTITYTVAADQRVPLVEKAVTLAIATSLLGAVVLQAAKK